MGESDLVSPACAVEGIAGMEVQQQACEQVLLKFGSLLVSTDTAKTSSIPFSITFNEDTTLEVPIILALQVPAVYQIATAASKLEWTSPEGAHDRVVEDIPLIWQACCALKKAVEKFPGKTS